MHQPWFSDLHDCMRDPSTPNRLPQAVNEAITTIAAVYVELVMRDALIAGRNVWGEVRPPSHWLVKPPPGLDRLRLEWVGTREKKEAYEREQARWRRELDENCALLREALAASDQIRGIEIASERLLYDLGLASMRGRDLVSVEVIEAFCAFRTFLAMFAHRPAVAAYLFQFDQMLARLRDDMFYVLARHVFAGRYTDAEREEAIAVMQRAADAGLWTDPEGDLERAEAAAAVA